MYIAAVTLYAAATVALVVTVVVAVAVAVVAAVTVAHLDPTHRAACLSTKSSPPSSSRSLPLSCICKIAGSGETSVVTFVAAFAEVEKAAVEIVTRGELRA